VLEAFVACDTPFDVEPRASFLGKAPGTLRAILGAPVDAVRLAEGILASYSEAYGRVAIDRGSIPPFESALDELRAEPPWRATVDEVIGVLGAGPDVHGRFRVGGDLLISRDALSSLEASLQDAADDDVAALVDAAIARPHVALDGVRSLASVRDVILAARAQKRA
jgi:hypothetical protein